MPVASTTSTFLAVGAQTRRCVPPSPVGSAPIGSRRTYERDEVVGAVGTAEGMRCRDSLHVRCRWPGARPSDTGSYECVSLSRTHSQSAELGARFRVEDA